jgi:hypothetical protein
VEKRVFALPEHILMVPVVLCVTPENIHRFQAQQNVMNVPLQRILLKVRRVVLPAQAEKQLCK